MNSNPLNVFFSNRIECLYEHLKTHLFIGSTPFTKRMVIVPSPAMKSWLTLQMANDPTLGIGAGVDIDFIDPAIHRLSLSLSPLQGSLEKNEKTFEPSIIDLCLVLEKEIREVVEHYARMGEQEKRVWGPLLTYLQGSKPSSVMTPKVAKRMTALAERLASYFNEYALYGSALLDKWNQEEASEWQTALWQRMESQFFLWNYPCRKFAAWQPQGGIKLDLQVHLFALPYLPALYHRFFLKAASQAPVNYYAVSPCYKFWEDVLCSKEGMKLKTYWQKKGASEAQLNDVDTYLRDTNPLLANFGKLEREMARQIEESHAITEEMYVLPKGIAEHLAYGELMDGEVLLQERAHPLTLLEAVQADIALLRNPQSSPPIAFDSYDETIQVHAAPKPLREVEAIYNAIVNILEKHQLEKGHGDSKETLSSRDVIVMAPDIATYAPLIHLVFGSEESLLKYQIMDVESYAQNGFVQGFMHLLRLPGGRWDAPGLLRLFECPSFQRKHRLSLEDIEEFARWIKLSAIRWGSDDEHRNELLQRDHCKQGMKAGSGTWEEGIGRLLEGLAMAPLANQAKAFSSFSSTQALHGSYIPLTGVDGVQGDLLGKCLYLLRSLLEDLKPLHDDSMMTPKEWSTYLKSLLEAYFSPGSEEDEAGLDVLVQQISLFEKVLPQAEGAMFLFHSILGLLEKALNQKNVVHREAHLNAVRFCSLLPMRLIPAQVIVFMGLDEENFPRKNERAKLNALLHATRKGEGQLQTDYMPLQSDLDRSLFLEALLSARRYLLMSYVCQNKSDSKELAPSLFVNELLNYLDSAYCFPNGSVSQHCVIKHAFYPFDRAYFEKKSAKKSYIPSHYKAALCHYGEKKQPPRVISAFSPLPQEICSQKICSQKTCSQKICSQKICSQELCHQESCSELTIELAELLAFARHPLKIYFNQALGIYVDKKEERLIPSEEELSLSHLQLALLCRESVFSSIPAVLKREENLRTLSQGPFGVLDEEKIIRETQGLKDNLHSVGADPDRVFSIEFSERFIEPACVEGNWQAPPLKIVTFVSSDVQKKEVTIVGKLERVSSQGLIVFGADRFEDAARIWPAFLVFCCLVQEYQLPIAQTLLFIKGKGGKEKKAYFEDPRPLLNDYLGCFFQGKKNALPFLPQWLLPLLTGNVEELKKMIGKKEDDPFDPLHDEYLKWMARNAPYRPQFAEEMILHCQELASHVFASMQAAWYPQKEKAVREEGDDGRE